MGNATLQLTILLGYIDTIRYTHFIVTKSIGLIRVNGMKVASS